MWCLLLYSLMWCFLLWFLIEVRLIYSIVLVPGLQQSDSVICCCCSVAVVFDCVWPHGLRHARSPCPTPSPRAHPSSCPLSQWCHIRLSHPRHPLLLLPSVFPSIRVFSSESPVDQLRWPKYWSFQLQHQSFQWVFIQGWFHLGLTGLISLLSRGLSRIFSRPQFKSINSSAFTFLYGPTLTSIVERP